ncbi:DUF4139 domain-containing protein [Paracoccus sphaerophysae]|uniref:Mucoidy inhibitor MuiA family protein n=1 Tax=Paracoccus sphaerophysae TaxID=690417 RepID=A0A099FGS0_9RHOB|nr:DUF4139 domain-containing protein [Paracoccus sphaerophysae]KGJ09431.1 hypothetical protein IC63_01305 [Paracoccus sphaerophysae]
MRPMLLPLLAATLIGSPVWAERLFSPAPVRAVTLYPDGATVTRSLRIDGAPGVHELVVTDLPPGIDAASLRVAATGARIGTVALQRDRALPGEDMESDAVKAAREELQRLEAALRDRDARVAAIRARAQAAEDTVAFLRALGQSDNATSGDVNALADNVAARLTAARREMIAAETEAKAAEVGREQDVEAVDRARAALAALQSPDNPPAALVISLQTQGPAEISITSQTAEASWAPAYDLRLSRAARAITLDRGLMVAQSTGEDWTDAALTLSTARPSGQVAASGVDPWFPRIEEQVVYDAAAAPAAPVAMAERSRAMVEVAPVVLGGGVGNAELSAIGTTVVYRYPTPVTIRTGADAVRLGMDSQTIRVEVMAEAVPLHDDSAYLRAEGTNTLPDVILPGSATLFADGAMVGQTQLPLIAAGDRLELGFGRIDGMRVERRVPEQTEGERGLIRSLNQRVEVATLRVENLTAEAWPLRVVDRVPVSTQDDLVVDWSAQPAPTETDPDGERGVLVWRTEIAPKSVHEITLTTRMRWPEGKVLFD